MWATFIGSTFSQMPLPGVRKSGMPEGTEMPAPVRTTVLEDSRRSSASCAALGCVAVPTAGRVAARSPAGNDVPSA